MFFEGLNIHNLNKIQEPKIRFISKKNHLAVFKWICPGTDWPYNEVEKIPRGPQHDLFFFGQHFCLDKGIGPF
jgi:hypothetical protein